MDSCLQPDTPALGVIDFLRAPCCGGGDVVVVGEPATEALSLFYVFSTLIHGSDAWGGLHQD